MMLISLAFAAHPLVHVNASLNATAALLLLVGVMFIRCGNIQAHKWTMLAAFAVSTAFLACYVWYHVQVGSVRFTHAGPIRFVYLSILVTHVLLAVTVPFLAVGTIMFGLWGTGTWLPKRVLIEADLTREFMSKHRARHRALARWTFPIWLYVSITGVVVYMMLYHLWPPTT